MIDRQIDRLMDWQPEIQTEKETDRLDMDAQIGKWKGLPVLTCWQYFIVNVQKMILLYAGGSPPLCQSARTLSW